MTELVKLIDGKAVTTSRKVAEIFEKEHCKVLRSIRELETPKNFNEANFGLVEYIDQKGEKRPEYLITRDGFTILAMGFTGKRAMQFKITYIEAFNAMEARLKENVICRPVTNDITASTIAVIEKINQQILADMEVDKEVLRYAWNIGKLINRSLRKALYIPGGVEEFIADYPCGCHSRSKVYMAYCQSCDNPLSPRQFWPCVRQCRSMYEKRKANSRYVVFE